MTPESRLSRWVLDSDHLEVPYAPLRDDIARLLFERADLLSRIARLETQLAQHELDQRSTFTD